MGDHGSLNGKQRKKFKKRKGTTNSGLEYEDLLVALLALGLSKNDQITNFYLSSNDNAYDKLDDLVFDYMCDNSKHKFVVQVKHKDRKKITPQLLGNKGGDFSIQQYYSSYYKLQKSLRDGIKCVLYTNADADLKEHDEFELEGTTLKIKVRKDLKPEALLNTSKIGFVYKFEVTEKNAKYEDFLEHFYLYSNQADVKTLKTSLKSLFTTTFISEESSFTAFLKYITDWSKLDGNKFCLDKNMVNTEIAKILLRPHLNTSSIPVPNLNLELLLEFCLAADVVAISSNLPFSSFSSLVEKQDATIREDVSLNSEEEKNKAVQAWLDMKAPLVLRVNKTNIQLIQKAVKLFQHDQHKMKFLFVTDGVDRSELTNFHVLENLNDIFIKCRDLYDKIVDQKFLSIQGRQKASLNVINEDARSALTVEELVKTDILQIGEEQEELPSPYIDQIVSKVFVRLNLIADFNIQSLIVISCDKRLDELNVKNTLTVKEFLQNNSNPFNFLFNKTIIVAEDFCTSEEFKKICQKSYKKCHHFVFKGDHLEWLESNGTISDLQAHFQRRDVEETEIFDDKKNINIISAKPGAGKSTMLKFLKKNISEKFWVVSINLREHALFFQQPHSDEDTLKYFLDFQQKSLEYNDLTIKIRQTYVDLKQVVFLWDGLDELPNVCLPQTIRTVQGMKKKGFINWVTTRVSLQNLLENNFQTFALIIKEMDGNHQKNYIKKQLNLEDNSEELNNVMKKITDIIAMTHDSGFLGIPLRLYILTELFLKNPINFKKLVESNVILPDIIKLFIEEKFNFSFKDKGKLNSNDSFINRAIDGCTKYRLQQYEILALKSFLPSDVFDNLNINTEDLLKDIEQVKNDFGLITKIDSASKTATFVHDVYGEFLVAEWMVKNPTRLAPFGSFFFEAKFRNIRIMFDFILARGCPAHIAVLHKDFESLFQHQDLVNTMDKGERTPLHLACSWGEAHPLLEPEDLNGVFVLKNTDRAVSVKEDNSEKFVEFLIRKKCDPHKKDKLFGWSSIEYADRSLSLFVINFLLTQTEFLLKDLKNFRDDRSVSYYCIKFDYQKLFEAFENINYVMDGQSGNNLMHLAVLHGRIHFLKKLLKNPKFIKHINDTNNERHLIQNIFFGTNIILESKQNPLHMAAALGNIDALDILLTNGAKINGVNQNRETPFHVAVKNKQLRSAQYLLQKDLDVNIADSQKNTVLHSLTFLGEISLIKEVLDKGALICQNSQNQTPLDLAQMRDRLDILKLLITKGRAQNVFFLLDYMLITLFNAVFGGQKKIIEFLISRNLDLNRIFENTTVLMQSVVSGRIDMVRFFLDKGADPNINPHHGYNALSLAIHHQQPEIVKLLIQFKANVNKCDENGYTTLMRAVLIRNFEITKIILTSKIQVEARASHGCAALHFAAAFGDGKIVELLLKHGANPNIKNKTGGTPLHVAAFYRRQSVVELLLKYDADPNAEAKGITPKHLMETPELTIPNNQYHVPNLGTGIIVNSFPVLRPNVTVQAQVSVTVNKTPSASGLH